LFLLFLIFLVSEGLLFVSFFWTSFHSLSSPTLGISQREGFYLPDPCELNFANTILLSNAAISLGNAFISLEISLQTDKLMKFFPSLNKKNRNSKREDMKSCVLNSQTGNRM
jgi:heme/copper-type cytochrome/quinol oxidase subunit 3